MTNISQIDFSQTTFLPPVELVPKGENQKLKIDSPSTNAVAEDQVEISGEAQQASKSNNDVVASLVPLNQPPSDPGPDGFSSFVASPPDVPAPDPGTNNLSTYNRLAGSTNPIPSDPGLDGSTQSFSPIDITV